MTARRSRPPGPARPTGTVDGALEAPSPAPRPLTLLRATEDVVVLRVAGSWRRLVPQVQREVCLALADSPRAVVADLSCASGDVRQVDLAPLVALGRYARDWPGTALALTSGTAPVRAALRRQPMGEHVHVAAQPEEAVAAIAREEPPVRAAVRLVAQPRAVRTARDFATRTCLDWRIPSAIPAAPLVVRELVANAVVNGGSDVEVTLVRLGSRLRVAVHGAVQSSPQHRRLMRTGGRGPVVVERLSRSWGTLPARDGGTVVWAVLADQRA